MIEPVYEKGYPCWDAVNNEGKYAMPLPEGRKALTDEDMVILLQNMARDAEKAKNKYLGSELRETADRFSELAKANKDVGTMDRK